MRRALPLLPLLGLLACEAEPALVPSGGGACRTALCATDGGAAGLRLHALVSDGHDAWAAGASGVLLRLSPGREQWLDSGTPQTLRALALGPDGALWGAGDAGTVIRLGPGATTRLDAPAAELIEVSAGDLVAIGVDASGLVFVSDGETTFAVMNGKLTELDGLRRVSAFHRTPQGLFAFAAEGIRRFDGSAFVGVALPAQPISGALPGVGALHVVAGAELYEVGATQLTAIGRLDPTDVPVAVREGRDGLEVVTSDGRIRALLPLGDTPPPPAPVTPFEPGAVVGRAILVGDAVLGVPLIGYSWHDGARFPGPRPETIPTAAAKVGEELLLFSAGAPPLLWRAEGSRPIGRNAFTQRPAWAIGQADGTALLGGLSDAEVWSFRPETGFVREAREALDAIGTHDGALDWQCPYDGAATVQRLVFGDEQVDVDATALALRCPTLAKQDAQGRWSLWACRDGVGARFELVDDVLIERERTPRCVWRHEVDPTGRTWERLHDLSGSAWAIDGAVIGDPFGTDTFAGFLADGTPLVLRRDEASYTQDLLALRGGEPAPVLTHLDVLTHWLEPSGALVVVTPGTILRTDAR